MGWIGACTRHNGWFNPPQSSAPTGTGPLTKVQLLTRGTLMVETRVSPEDRPQTLLALDRCFPWPSSFSLRILPGGSVVMVDAQGRDSNSCVMPCPYVDRSDLVRIHYSWDSTIGQGRLAIERPEPDSLHIVDLANTNPMILNDLGETLVKPAMRAIDRDVAQIAVSDQIEPVGPRPGLTGRTPVMTPHGERFIRDLKRGDLVVTDKGQSVPILHMIRHVVPAQGGFHPVRLRAGYFGLTRDLVVAPDQRIVLQGSEVEYMFGQEAVSIPARHLLNDTSAVLAQGPRTVAFYQVILPGHEVIMSSGCPLESLYIGRIRRKPEKMSISLLSHIDRARLPEHPKPVWRVLKPFEAITLAAARAA